ncbi:MAG TPA: hypothetical protein VGK53_03835 [Propionicimonas sp.]
METELAQALGHLRQASHQLLSLADPSGQELLLAARILDLEELLGELGVEPTYVSAAGTAKQSLLNASSHLIRATPPVPSSVWPTLRSLLAMTDGYGNR